MDFYRSTIKRCFTWYNAPRTCDRPLPVEFKVSIPEDRIFNRVISNISVVLRETTLTITDSIGTGSPVESEIVRVVFPSTTEMAEITRSEIKTPIFRVRIR